jgi:UDP-N-acetylmuramoyl-tripeptide--D-alanyl-D-alanine ligase
VAETAAHEEIGRLAVSLDVDRLVVVGEQARAMLSAAQAMHRAAGNQAMLVPDAQAALALLRAELRSGDVVLVKASRAHRLERVADGLLMAGGGSDA